MSNQSDSPPAQEDPHVNLCDLYPGTTLMMMTVNPDAELPSTTA